MSDTSPCKRSSYDIIIAGGGTAGCVLATRLSELPHLEVLLLEAGVNQNDNPLVKTPGLWSQALHNPDLDWDYRLAPQEELDGMTPLLTRGKGLGGSTLLNALSLLYPSRAGYDAWTELGNEGWDWDSLFPYLKKFQNFNQPSEKVARDIQMDHVNPKDQGVGGPIQASYEMDVDQLDKAWVETFRNLGMDMKADTLSGDATGGYQIVNTIDPKTRERSHAGNAYLAKAMDRPNLEIITSALINRIVFTDTPDTDTEPKVKGIEFLHNNQTYVANTTSHGEIIICAGTIGSPGILERSGIGNPELLQDLGIKPVVANKNVGENLHDHFLNGVSFELKDGVPSLDDFRDPANIQKAIEQYQKDRSGPLGKSFPSFAYMPLFEPQKSESETESNTATTNGDTTTAPNPIPTYPTFSSLLTNHLSQTPTEIQSPIERATLPLLAPPNATANISLMKLQCHLSETTAPKMFAPSTPGNYLTLVASPCHPLSRGSVHITTPHPSAPPTIDPKYYSHPLDKELISRHIQFFPHLLSTPPLSNYIKLDGRTIPHDARFDTPEDTKKIMRTSCMSMQHPVGSCAMMSEGFGGVVDDRLRVFGVMGVRVCDASVFPVIPRGTLMATVYAVAERGADLVKEDLGGEGRG